MSVYDYKIRVDRNLENFYLRNAVSPHPETVASLPTKLWCIMSGDGKQMGAILSVMYTSLASRTNAMSLKKSEPE